MIREVVKATGDIITVAGNGTGGYSGDNGPATAAELDLPMDVAVDSAGDLFIADMYNNVIREVVKATGDIITVAGDGIQGFSGDNGPATAALLFYPSGVAVDAAGNLFIADTNNNAIREVVKATGKIVTVAGNETYGYSGDNGPATAARLATPEGVAVDTNGNVFIGDTNNNVVRELVKVTGNIITVAGNGTFGYSGDKGLPTAAELAAPRGVTLDSVGDLFIADLSNNTVREVVKATGDIITVAGDGTQGYSGDNGPATAALLFYPFGVAVDSAGNLFVADTDNDVVRWATPAVTVTIDSALSGYVVTNTNDSGPGSLRQAILNADANDSVPVTISFNIPESDPGFAAGVFTIEPLSQLPVLSRNITIDGTTQAAFTGNTNPYGPVIVINGAKQSSGDGLELDDNNTVKDLDINDFQSVGINLSWSFSSGGVSDDNQIIDNYVGTDPTGTVADANGTGVSIVGFASPTEQSSGNLIEGNLISGNSGNGIEIADSSQTQVIDNLIGTDRSGMADLGNGGNGIGLGNAGAPSNTIEGNTIAFNTGDGIQDAPDYRYSVAYTTSGHEGNAFLQNSIFSNGLLGIDLRAPGTGGNVDVPAGIPLQNTPGGPHQGANLLQNYPVLASAVSSTSSTVVTGSLNSTPNTSFHLEFFAGPTANASGYGEGKTYLGDTSVTTDASGNASFSVTLPVGSLVGQVLSADRDRPRQQYIGVLQGHCCKPERLPCYQYQRQRARLAPTSDPERRRCLRRPDDRFCNPRNGRSYHHAIVATADDYRSGGPRRHLAAWLRLGAASHRIKWQSRRVRHAGSGYRRRREYGPRAGDQPVRRVGDLSGVG